MSEARLCVATGDAIVRMMRNGDGGWSAHTCLEGSGVQCLAADPRARHVVYAGSASSGVYKSEDGGENWRPLADTAGLQVFSLAVSPSWRGAAGGVVFAGTEPSALYVSETGGKGWRELASLRAIPSAPTWSFPPRPWTSHVRSIALSPFAPDLILAGIELGGVMRSTDFGETWEDHRPGAYRDSHALSFHPRVPGRAYEAAGDGGAARSFDEGETWEPEDAGLLRRYGWALAIDAVDPDCWYVSASPGPAQAHYQLGRADSVIYGKRGAGPWVVVGGTGMPSPSPSLISALFADPEQPGLLYAGLRSGEIFASADFGDTWEALPIHAPAVAALCGCG